MRGGLTVVPFFYGKAFMKRLLIAFWFSLFVTGCAPSTETIESDMPQTNNHIDYVEFAASDLDVFKTFYGAAFGWEFQDWGPDYSSFSGAGIDGGVHGGEAPVNGSTLVILYADDLDISEKNVVEAGGEITERHDFPGGKRFHFRDPTGNVLGVWMQVEVGEEPSE